MPSEKIIIWNQGEIFPFLLANSLQKKINAELYGIFDVPERQKPFFQNQKIVDFKKIWFFHDNISKPRKKVDIDYLTSFEEKYNLNLWLLALNERLFNEYNEFYKFSREEILSILEDECKLFEKILEIKPKFLISYKSTFHHHELFHQMCKTSGVKPLIFSASVLANRCMITEEPNIFDDKRTIEELQSTNRDFDELQKYWKKFELRKQFSDTTDTLRKSKAPKINAGFDFLFSKNITSNNYGYYGHTKSKALSNYVATRMKQKNRSAYMDKNFLKVIDDSTPFVYFPLHQMPERELLIASPFNTNQIETIKHIAKSLPIGYRLFVKEHPSQVTREWRDISFYEEILSIPNVQLLHYSIKSEDVLKKCSLVITIHGASGLEAAMHKKPAIIFSDFFYSILPSVYTLQSIEELPSVIRSSLQTEVHASDVDKFLNLLEENSIDFDLFGFELDYHNYFFYEGNLLNVEIDEEKAKRFIKKYESPFGVLADEFIKKMQNIQK